MHQKKVSSVEDYIIEMIKKNKKKSISLAKFMNISLYDENLGYYMRKNPFGLNGDFITAPEISQLFGETIAVWLLDTWARMKKPKKFTLVECGPGSGTLMQDVVRVTKKFTEFSEAMQLHMVEISPVLQQMQKEKLFDCDIKWHRSVNTLPPLPTLLIANEFFDAMPTHQYIFDGSNWLEVRVAVDERTDSLQLVHCKSEFAFSELLHPGAFIERCYLGLEIMKSIAAQINEYGGSGLIIDYGYINPTYTSTIQSLRKHQYNYFLDNIGDSDITFHVDFGQLQNCVQPMEFELMSQREFLLSFGAFVRFEVLQRFADDLQKRSLQSGFARITEAMGDLFKVLVLNPIAIIT